MAFSPWPLNIINCNCSLTVRLYDTDYRAINAKCPVTTGHSGRCSAGMWFECEEDVTIVFFILYQLFAASSCFCSKLLYSTVIYTMIQVLSSDHLHHAQHNIFTLSDNETTPLPLISSPHELDNSSDSWLRDWWAPRSRALASVWRAIPSACNEPRLASSPAHRARHPRLATVRPSHLPDCPPAASSVFYLTSPSWLRRKPSEIPGAQGLRVYGRARLLITLIN